jgi:hypothetical protein
MSLAPTISARLGNLRYEQQVVEASCHLGLLPVVNRCTVVLPAAVRFEAEPGDPAELTLDGGDKDGPGASATVLTGTVRSIRRSALTVEVTSSDAGADLARLRPALTFTGQDAGAVVRALAGAAGAEVADADVDLPLAFFVAHQNRTAGEHVAELARLGAAIAVVDGDGQLAVRALPAGQPDSVLLWGRELLHYEVRATAAPVAVVAVGFGTAGSTSDPAILRQSVDALSNGASEPGAEAIWRPSAALRVPAAVRTAGGGLDARDAGGATRFRARCLLLPTLRPGSVITIQEAPGDLDAGPWMLTSVTHRVDAGGAGSTVVTGELAGASGDGGLLGAAVGALGSLL